MPKKEEGQRTNQEDLDSPPQKITSRWLCGEGDKKNYLTDSGSESPPFLMRNLKRVGRRKKKKDTKAPSSRRSNGGNHLVT
ncbi:hypothetical protein M0802_014786 [Mischocyttarus mexicanus]|nr:hypothetical protein M0802_014786 [Mischocyttarus mexicanus]